MSKLIFDLKNDLNFNKKVSLYIPKEIKYDSIFRELGKRSIGAVINSAILNFVYSHIDLNEDLYNQLKFNKDVNKFFQAQDYFETTITLKEYKKNYEEIRVLRWHLIFCLTNLQIDFNQDFNKNILSFINCILDDNFNNFISRNHKKSDYFIEETIDNRNLKKLKILHGTTDEKSTITKCIEFYAISTINYKNNINTNKNIINSVIDEQKAVKNRNVILVKLPAWVENYINLYQNTEINITEILIFNLQVHYNLFREQWR